ncbi:cyclin-dependent kinase inhibitor 7-like protein [Tanacetum coccineum]
MEVTRVGVRTRARAKTTKVVAGEEIADNLGSRKRRRLSDAKKRPHSSSSVQTRTVNREVSVNLTSDCSNAAARLRSSSAPASCCSSTRSVEKLKVSDLEEDIISAENETVVRHNLDGSESTPTMEKVKTQSVELDSCTPKQSSVTAQSCTKMPSEAELEEFFTAANKDLKKRFTDKYNYDIVNDIPLKGRFEWIQLKPAT